MMMMMMTMAAMSTLCRRWWEQIVSFFLTWMRLARALVSRAQWRQIDLSSLHYVLMTLRPMTSSTRKAKTEIPKLPQMRLAASPLLHTLGGAAPLHDEVLAVLAQQRSVLSLPVLYYFYHQHDILKVDRQRTHPSPFQLYMTDKYRQDVTWSLQTRRYPWSDCWCSRLGEQFTAVLASTSSSTTWSLAQPPKTSIAGVLRRYKNAFAISKTRAFQLVQDWKDWVRIFFHRSCDSGMEPWSEPLGPRDVLAIVSKRNILFCYHCHIVLNSREMEKRLCLIGMRQKETCEVFGSLNNPGSV